MARVNEPQDWQFNPMRDWRARAWFIATVTAWLSFVVALWASFLWPDLRTLAFAGIWLFVAFVLAAATMPVKKGGGDGDA